eukprot:1448409-Amphidinium_carterae.2
MGILGIDRCYMGQPILGVLKGLTCGGCCGIWAIIDFVIIAINCLQSLESINAGGFKAQFNTVDIAPAWWITLVLLIFHVSSAICRPSIATAREPSRKRPQSSDGDGVVPVVDVFMTQAPERPALDQPADPAEQLAGAEGKQQYLS